MIFCHKMHYTFVIYDFLLQFMHLSSQFVWVFLAFRLYGLVTSWTSWSPRVQTLLCKKQIWNRWITSQVFFLSGRLESNRLFSSSFFNIAFPFQHLQLCPWWKLSMHGIPKYCSICSLGRTKHLLLKTAFVGEHVVNMWQLLRIKR